MSLARGAHLAAALAAWVLGISLHGCDGCTGCGEEAAVAELVALEGEVTRDWANSRERWQDAEVGAQFAFGDGVRTGESATAALSLTGGSNLDVEPSTVIRFLSSMPNQQTPGVDVETGSAILEAGDDRVSVRTQVGSAVLEAGTRMRLAAGEDGLRYEVLVGRAEIEHEGADARQLGEGEELLVSVGGAVLEDDVPEEEPDAGPPPDAGSADAGPPPDGPIQLDVRGRGVRSRAPGERRWRALGRGEATVEPGTSVRLPRRAEIGLRRGDASATLTGPGVFVVGEGEALVQATTGGVSFEAGTHEVVIAVPGGTIVARAGGSQGEASVDSRRGTEVRSIRGTLEVKAEDGSTQLVEPGESARIQRGGELDWGYQPPARADFVVEAGSSFTVRDPSTPAAVGFRFGSLCPGAGVVELAGVSGSASHGEGSANLALPPGRHRYQIKCVQDDGTVGGAVEQGVVRVLRDSGRMMLPRIPPASVVDTDGRRYTVLYQNLLPQITVRWPNPRGSGPYQLIVTTGGQTRSFNASEARHQFEAGALGEGVHKLVFRAGTQRSPETTLAIGFDNAAPTAAIREPSDGSFAPGDTVRVAGVALEGWSVSVGGTELPLDPQQRFDAQVAVPPNQDGIAIRLSHPSRGVHYYVRHGSR